MTITGMKESNYQNYRAGLIEKGILEANAYGKIDFALPRFGEFIRVNMVYYLWMLAANSYDKDKRRLLEKAALLF